MKVEGRFRESLTARGKSMWVFLKIVYCLFFRVFVRERIFNLHLTTEETLINSCMRNVLTRILKNHVRMFYFNGIKASALTVSDTL